MVDALLCTGSRSAEILCLRTEDIKKTKAGIYHFDFLHQPQAKYPTSLKGGDSGERKTPMHQRLIDKGLPKLISEATSGYLMNRYTT